MYLKIFQVFVVLLFIYLICTEVVIPLFKGTKLFPMWNDRRKKLDQDFVDTREALELKTKEGKLNQLKSLLNQKETKS